MKRTTTPHLREPSEADIQHAAYLLWIEEGRPEGRDLAHWHAARELLLHRCRVSRADRRRPAPMPAVIPPATSSRPVAHN